MIQHNIPIQTKDTPLRIYLRRAYPAVPEYIWRETLKKKDVRVNGTRSDGSCTVRGGDTLLLYIPSRYVDTELHVLYDGQGLLVVEKPQGIPVDTDEAGIGADTVLERARTLHPDVRLCHRLDAGTGGVLLLAYDEQVYEAVLAAFREERVEKEYSTCVWGKAEPPSGMLTGYIVKDAKQSRVRLYSEPVPGGRYACSEYEMIGSSLNCTVLRVRIHTGRTHQIRVQLAAAGWPVLGDDKYGDRAANESMHVRQCALWCSAMTLNGPGIPDAVNGVRFCSTPRFPLWKKIMEESRQ